MIYNQEVTDFFGDGTTKYKMIFADPPDNIGLKYLDWSDKLSPIGYYSWFENWMRDCLKYAEIVWISYYWKHDLKIKCIANKLLTYYFPTFDAKTFIWRFTFGQHNSSDCGSGFRFLLRFKRTGAVLYPDAIRETSARLRSNDSRADERGKVPDDVLCQSVDDEFIYEIPRVTGNSFERRDWVPTQHPEELMTKLILLSTTEGDKILDLFGGSGTTAIIAKRHHRKCDTVEITADYCEKIAELTDDCVILNQNKVVYDT